MHYASRAYPRSDGQVEVTNREIKKGIKRRLQAAKEAWTKELHSVLWAFRTTTRTATGETPYSMAFGSEAVVPVEVEILNQRTTTFDEHSNCEELRTGLDLL